MFGLDSIFGSIFSLLGDSLIQQLLALVSGLFGGFGA